MLPNLHNTPVISVIFVIFALKQGGVIRYKLAPQATLYRVRNSRNESSQWNRQVPCSLGVIWHEVACRATSSLKYNRYNTYNRGCYE
jgi:hypothetical protein